MKAEALTAAIKRYDVADEACGQTDVMVVYRQHDELRRLAIIGIIREARLLVQPQPVPEGALWEENARLRAAINRMAYRMDSLAAQYAGLDVARGYMGCADIVSDELARAALQPE